MNPFERSVWVLFTFIASIILMAFIFLARQFSYCQGIKADDEIEGSIAEDINEVSREG